MKEMSYYNGDDLPPVDVKRENYTSYYFYKRGTVLTPEEVKEIVGENIFPSNLNTYSPAFESALKKEGVTMERDFDRESYNKAYNAKLKPFYERRREFKEDLFEFNGYKAADPLAELIYSRVSEDSSSLYEIKDSFSDLDEFVTDAIKIWRDNNASK